MKRSQSEFSPYHDHISKIHCQWPSVDTLSLKENTENRQNLNTSLNTTVFNDSGYSSFLDISPQISPINYKKQAIKYYSPLNTPKFSGYSSENESSNKIKEETSNKKKIGRKLFSNDNNYNLNRENYLKKEDNYNYDKERITNNLYNTSFLSNQPNTLLFRERQNDCLQENNLRINNYSNDIYDNNIGALSPDTFLQTFDEEQWFLRKLGIITNDSDYLFVNESKMINDRNEKETCIYNIIDDNTPSPIKRFIEEEKKIMEKRNKMYKNVSSIEYDSKHLININCCKNYHDVKLFQKKAFHLAFRAENPDKTLYNQIKCRKFSILREKDRLRQIDTEKRYYENKSREEADKAKEISKEMTVFLKMIRTRGGKKIFSDNFIKYCFAKTPQKDEILRKADLFLALYGDGSNNENVSYRNFAKFK
ncbi:Hypothetical protein SRAE_X000136100 [Strongyloides ratti]|uniref:Uncharacterized protein n=1 Tax=Strongyloides ratti TaxID=34506 RepID=A0A090KUS0_STRRB|nr:Hypothetical protein SRAE_X000136100 [Strongyloides ratti]CEF59615.1 Hypothetical protein SRAE_X000136100 [Strongyloides ratti]